MNNGETSKVYSEILRRIDGVRRKENRLTLFYGLFVFLTTLYATLFLAGIIEGIASFGTASRTVIFIISAIALTAFASWFVVRPLLRVLGVIKSTDNRTTALLIGQHFPQVRDRLLNAIQLYDQRERLQENYSLALIDASFSDLYRQIQSLDFLKAVSSQRVRKFGRIVSLSSIAIVLLFVLSPLGFRGSLYRIVNFNQSFAAEPSIQLSIEPGNIDVVRGQEVPITIRTQGKPVQQISFYTRQYGQAEFDQLSLKQSDGGIFRTEISNIKASTEYYASAEDVKSDRFTINVLDRPLVRSLQLSIRPPSYTRLPLRTPEENVGDMEVYAGSVAGFTIVSSKELSSANLIFNDTSSVKLLSEGTKATGSLRAMKNRTYHLSLKDKNTLANIDPVEYSIKIIPDEYPTVEILAPAKNLDMTEETKLDLIMRLKDDFGFSKLRLAYRLTQSRYEKPSEEFSFIDIPLDRKTLTPIDVNYRWDLSPMHLAPEDVVEYHVEVFDNDNVNGPKSGKSETYLVRVPSLEEVFSDVSQSQHESMQSMQDISKETQELKKSVEEMQRDLKKNTEKTDWQQQKKAEQMVQRYEQMKKTLEETAKKMDDMVKKMDENKLLSEETLQKYQELQKLMEELNSPELQKALKKLQESMKQPTPDQMKQAMDQLKANEEQFRKNLERTIELLKRIAIEQKLDEMIKRAEEMSKQQESVSKEMAQTPQSDQQQQNELAKKQSDLQQQMESFEHETSELKKSMEEFPEEMPLKEMSKTDEHVQQNQTSQKMKSASQQMASGNSKGAQQTQNDAQKDIDQDMQEMKDIQKQMRDNQMKQIANQMKKQLQNILEISKHEEALKNESKSMDPNSQRFRQHAESQNDEMNNLSNVTNAMSDLGKKTFAVSPQMGKELGDALKHMGEAMQNMEGRSPGGTSQKEGEAMSSLNRAAMQMQDALSSMGKGQGGMGMAGLMGRLGQMAGQQSGINSGTQQAMGGQGQGQGMNPEQQATYQRLAQQQGGLQKSLKDLSEEAKNTGDFSKLMGDLDRVAQEMQEVQTDLVQGNVNPETIKKQDRILSRLLDASRSTRERDYEQRRRSEAGKNIRGTSPAQIDLTTQEGKNQLREEMLKALEGKYSKDYEELIRKYFEQLEKQEVQQ